MLLWGNQKMADDFLREVSNKSLNKSFIFIQDFISHGISWIFVLRGISGPTGSGPGGRCFRDGPSFELTARKCEKLFIKVSQHAPILPIVKLF